jgi:hypothetical protein
MNLSISVARAVHQGHHTHYEGGSPGLILKAVDNVSVAPIFTFVFVPTIPMVSMPFDINLEENAHRASLQSFLQGL